MGKRHLNPEQPQSFYRAFERISVQRRARASLAQSSAELARRSAQSPACSDERVVLEVPLAEVLGTGGRYSQKNAVRRPSAEVRHLRRSRLA